MKKPTFKYRGVTRGSFSSKRMSKQYQNLTRSRQMKSYFLEFQQDTKIGGLHFTTSELGRIEANSAMDARGLVRQLCPTTQHLIKIHTVLPSRKLFMRSFPGGFKRVPGVCANHVAKVPFFVTFGSNWHHNIQGVLLNGRCQGRIWAYSYEEAYEKATFIFGDEFVNVYERERLLKWYPDGIRDVPELGAPSASPPPPAWDPASDAAHAMGAGGDDSYPTAVPQDEFGIKSDPNYDYMKSIKDFVG